ncbi:hypothetical protein [Lysinibacter sp. HNR]|uniref:hypothetical protein n=1 Tax=Lysinibacter sp. HNR TaxID=3031408 RepID=UPI002435C14C|nr:hypothetical protein [Lysinibacter sp. HNR]WGD36604.1 hypothetical protein FrondiHNR_09025 [Lysinibacter sp. HNR]
MLKDQETEPHVSILLQIARMVPKLIMRVIEGTRVPIVVSGRRGVRVLIVVSGRRGVRAPIWVADQRVLDGHDTARGHSKMPGDPMIVMALRMMAVNRIRNFAVQVSLDGAGILVIAVSRIGILVIAVSRIGILVIAVSRIGILVIAVSRIGILVIAVSRIGILVIAVSRIGIFGIKVGHGGIMIARMTVRKERNETFVIAPTPKKVLMKTVRSITGNGEVGLIVLAVHGAVGRGVSSTEIMTTDRNLAENVVS